jgi:hypothetical protein
VAGVAALIRMFLAARRVAGLLRLVVSGLWGLVALLAMFGLMVAAAWALRASREVFHPWYAHPDRLFALIIAAGVCGWWDVGRIAALLPSRFRPVRHPAIAWLGLLIAWIGIAAATMAWTPAASYLVAIPLLAAGIVLIGIRAQDGSAAIRLASLVPLAVAILLWARLGARFMQFIVLMFGRLPVIAPVFALPSLVVALFVAAPASP